MSLPLSGIRVLSVTRLLPGAYCTRLLLDLGAEITMVEHPIGGDPMRNRPSFFSAMNCNKKSLTLDMKQDQGREICYKLAQNSDVFIESFRPGVAARLGIDYSHLKEMNPGIVYASISGYGQEGPYSRIPGHDLMFQAISGMLAGQLSNQSERFTHPLVPTADMSSGMFAAMSILAALYQRKETGKGQYLDVSMTDGLVSWMSIHLSDHSMLNNQSPMAGYGIFKTRDEKYVALGIDEEAHFWRNLCKVLKHEEIGELTPQERIKRYDELTHILKDAFITRNRKEWIQLLVSADVPVSPAYISAVEIIQDPQLLYRGMVSEKDNRIFTGSPLPMARGQEPEGSPPSLGEHTLQILSSLGYNSEEIRKLKQAGVI